MANISEKIRETRMRRLEQNQNQNHFISFGLTCREKVKYRGSYCNENMEDGSEWTPKDRKTKTEVAR